MAYKYRTAVERVAEELAKLTFKEMQTLASALSDIAGDREGFDFGNIVDVSELLADWAEATEDEYASRPMPAD